jgi:hypothetical protein
MLSTWMRRRRRDRLISITLNWMVVLAVLYVAIRYPATRSPLIVIIAVGYGWAWLCHHKPLWVWAIVGFMRGLR